MKSNQDPQDPFENLWSLSNHAITTVLHADRWAICAWAATLSRLPLAFACVTVLLSRENPVLASALIGLMILVDILDGRLFLLAADRTTQLHRKLLDAVLDRLLIQAVLIAATLAGALPLTFYVVFTLREALLVAAVLSPMFTHGRILHANLPSRAATALMGLIVMNHLTQFIALNLLLVAFLACAALGLAMYSRPTTTNP